MIKKENNIGIIGAGNMSNALISGLVKAGYKKSQIYASSPEEDHLKILREKFSVNVTKENEKIIETAGTVILAVKPYIADKVVKSLAKTIIKDKPLLISIVAGLTINSIENEIGVEAKIIRAMPNTPASIGMGVAALSHNGQISEQDRAQAEFIFSSVGIFCWLEEKSFDLYTSLIGSGPAYIFLMIEAFQKAAIKLNLDDTLTKQLITEMFIGSATLVKLSDEEPKSLKARVTSPGGVTEAALNLLNSNDFSKLFEEAIKEGENKSLKLSRGKDV